MALDKKKKAVEVKIEEEKPDLFDEVFGLDEEKEKARARINELVKEEKGKIDRISKIREKYSKKDSEMEQASEIKELHEDTKPGKEPDAEPKPKTIDSTKPVEPKPVKAKEPKPSEKENHSSKKPKEPAKSETAKEKTPQIAAIAEEQEKKAEEIVAVKKPKEPKIKPELSFLNGKNENESFIGRKKSVFEQFGNEAGLFIGEVNEEEFPKNKVLLDSLNPHVVFVCGARGSGKSYAMGVIAEELALKNKNVGVIVIDPVGVFWSMRFPNREKKEVEALGEWGLSPKGLNNLYVFIPKGAKSHTPLGTYDDTFSLKPSLLTAHDWCLTFGIDRFSPTGLLLEKALYKVRHGYKNVDGKRIEGKGNNYSLDDICRCLSTDAELNSRETGYKGDSIRALISRFEASKSWGILDNEGTPLNQLSKEGQLTIIDTSFLDDVVTALVIGILARRILSARKISTRKEAASRLETATAEDIAEIEIPPTWLFIDEAHTLIPGGNMKTPATDALVEYVKQGRRPGCSIVFATQQPSAIDIKILSQLDIVLCHKLVFNDDVKAVFKRMPSIIPHAFKSSNFIKTIPVGSCLVGDRREETSRAFLMRVRPRMSQHEGREAETVQVKRKLSNAKVLELLVRLHWGRLKRMSFVLLKDIKREVESFNSKYSSTITVDEVIEELKKRGAILDEKHKKFILPEKRPVEKAEEKGIEEPLEEEKPEKIEQKKAVEEFEPPELLLSFPVRIKEKQARKALMKNVRGRIFGFIGGKESLKEIRLANIPVFKVHFNYFTHGNSFRQGVLFINSLSGEFIQFYKNAFVESTGLRDFYNLSRDEIILLNHLKKKKSYSELQKLVPFSESKMKRVIGYLIEKDILLKEKKKGVEFFSLKKKFDLPSSPLHPLLSSLENLPVTESDVLMRVKENYSRKDVSELLKRIWPKLVVKKIEEIYWPAYEGTLEDESGSTRVVLIDAVNGKTIIP